MSLTWSTKTRLASNNVLETSPFCHTITWRLNGRSWSIHGTVFYQGVHRSMTKHACCRDGGCAHCQIGDAEVELHVVSRRRSALNFSPETSAAARTAILDQGDTSMFICILRTHICTSLDGTRDRPREMENRKMFDRPRRVLRVWASQTNDINDQTS